MSMNMVSDVLSFGCSLLFLPPFGFLLGAFDDRVSRQSGKSICLLFSISEMDVAAVRGSGGLSPPAFRLKRFCFSISVMTLRSGLTGATISRTSVWIDASLGLCKRGVNCLPSFMAPCGICIASWFLC
jgi:hypothetical protein